MFTLLNFLANGRAIMENPSQILSRFCGGLDACLENVKEIFAHTWGYKSYNTLYWAQAKDLKENCTALDLWHTRHKVKRAESAFNGTARAHTFLLICFLTSHRKVKWLGCGALQCSPTAPLHCSPTVAFSCSLFVSAILLTIKCRRLGSLLKLKCHRKAALLPLIRGQSALSPLNGGKQRALSLMLQADETRQPEVMALHAELFPFHKFTSGTRVLPFLP